LENCVNFLDGKRKPIKSSDRKSELKLYPYYGASGIIDYIDDYILDGRFILLSEDGANIIDRNYRVAFIAEGKIWVNNHAHVLLPNKNVNIVFLTEKLESLDYNIYNTGTTMPKLNQEVCRNILIRIPILEEQSKIGNLLAIINERIATQNKIIEDLKKLKSAIYQFVFDNEIGPFLPLESIANIVKGQQVNGECLSESGDYYVMNGGIEPSGYYSYCNTEANTISISEGGNSCGYVQYNDVLFWSGGHCYTLQNLSTQIEEKYLFHYLKHKESTIMKLRIGTGLPNIQKKDLAKFNVLIPSTERQIALYKVFNSVDAKLSIENKLQKSFESQKSYLLQQMFI